jgi:hypothetical protein
MIINREIFILLFNQDRQPILKRLINQYCENGLIGVIEEINSLPRKSKNLFTV